MKNSFTVKTSELNMLANGEVTSGSELGLGMSGSDEVFVFPATPAQRRFWELDQLAPGNTGLNVPLAWRLVGELDEDALRESLQEVVRRHEALRTTFTVRDGKLLQVIAPEQKQELPILDLCHLPEEEREPRAEELVRKEARQPFSLEDGPLLRTTLLRVTPADHILLVTMHHIICDGWSNGLILQEVGTLYGAFTHGQPSPLSELELQYADFAAWQEERLQSGAMEQDLAYWKEKHHAPLPTLDLPTDGPRLPGQAAPSAIESLLLPDTVTTSLRAFCHREGATMFMLFLAVFEVLLHRYTGAEDMLIGSPHANRPSVQLEELIGLFSNPMLLRADLSGDPTFRELLGRVRTDSLDAIAHGECPFEMVLEQLPPDNGRGLNPLMQVYFVYQRAFMRPIELPRLKFLPQRSVTPGALQDLMLGVLERDEGVRMQLEHNTRLFTQETAVRMLGHLSTLLQAAVATPEQRISELPLLTTNERSALRGGLCRTATSNSLCRSLYQYVEAQAKCTPEAIAVLCDGEAVTYADLNTRANRLARLLSEEGVGPGAQVGIWLEPSGELCAAMLAVLKAGGAFVALSSCDTPPSIRSTAGELDLSLVLTRTISAGSSPFSGRLLMLDGVSPGQLAGDGDVPPSVGPDALACMVFTDGATAAPRPVYLEHRILVARAYHLGEHLGVAADDQVLVSGPAGSAACLQTLFMCWSRGAAANLASGVSIASGVLERVAKDRCTVLQLPVRTWETLLIQACQSEITLPPTLRLVFTYGDRPSYAIRRIWDTRPNVRALWRHAYFTVEGGFIASARVDDPARPASDRLELGDTLRDMSVLVLDRNLQLLPAGVPGELYIAGSGVLPSPGNVSAECSYVSSATGVQQVQAWGTGDVGRYRPGGEIEFLYRRDQQIVCQGLRVTAEDVERVLEQHPSVSRAQAFAEYHGTCRGRLVAYVNQLPANPRSNRALLSFLREQLPDYLTPKCISELSTLRITPGGRIDIRSLPQSDHEHSFVAPVDQTELQLVKLWEEVLGITSVGTDDSFFDLGGQSIQAVRLFAQIEELFGRSLPLSTLFHAPTISQLAALIRKHTGAHHWQALVPIQSGGTRQPLFCMHRDDGLVMCYQLLAELLGPDQPVYGLQDISREDTTSTTVAELAAAYLEEMRLLQPTGPFHLLGSSFGGIVAYEMAQQLRKSGEEVALLGLLDTVAPKNFQRPKPLIERAAIHFANIRNGDAKAKLSYVSRKLGRRIRKELGAINELLEVVPVDRLPEDLLRMQAKNLQAYRHYEPEPWPGKMILFRARERHEFADNDPCLQWGNLITGELETRDVPGNHLTMLKEPHVVQLAQSLRDALSRCAGL